MAKLVEIAVREIAQWDDDWVDIIQNLETGMVSARKKDRSGVRLRVMEIGDDCNGVGIVTRAQWEAECARIADDELIEDPFPDTPDEALKRAANRKATQEAREIARTDTMTAEEQELADIACGKRSREDQALWSDLARDIFRDLAKTCSEAVASRGLVTHDDVGYRMAHDAFDLADAFMAERAKRLKGM